MTRPVHGVLWTRPGFSHLAGKRQPTGTHPRLSREASNALNARSRRQPGRYMQRP